jgi:hypothetical protein
VLPPVLVVAAVAQAAGLFILHVVQLTMLVLVAGEGLVFSGKGLMALLVHIEELADLVGQQAQLVQTEPSL